MLANSKLDWWVLGLAWAWQTDTHNILLRNNVLMNTFQGKLSSAVFFFSRLLHDNRIIRESTSTFNTLTYSLLEPIWRNKNQQFYKMYLLSQPVWKNCIYTLDWSTLKVVQAGSGCFWKRKIIRFSFRKTKS